MDEHGLLQKACGQQSTNVADPSDSRFLDWQLLVIRLSDIDACCKKLNYYYYIKFVYHIIPYTYICAMRMNRSQFQHL